MMTYVVCCAMKTQNPSPLHKDRGLFRSVGAAKCQKAGSSGSLNPKYPKVGFMYVYI